jgi:hypothetical protein
MEAFSALSQVLKKRGQRNDNRKNKKSLRKKGKNLTQRDRMMLHKSS